MTTQSPPTITIRPATRADLPAVAELAGIIWRQHYPGIISAAQIEYMLARMYDLAGLREELEGQGIRYFLLYVAAAPVGFAAVGPTPEPGVMKLHKCYLQPAQHGRGYGRQLLQHCENTARELGARQLVLAVNKRNVKAITAYERHGFHIQEAVVSEIGAGFVMDDYLMVKILAPNPHRSSASR